MSKSKNSFTRLYLNIGVLVALFFLPWWVSLVAGMIAMRWFNYYELIGIGFVLDLLYGSSVIWKDHYLYPPLFFMWLSFAYFVAFQLIKKRVRLH